jgi:hypothetical protein
VLLRPGGNASRLGHVENEYTARTKRLKDAAEQATKLGAAGSLVESVVEALADRCYRVAGGQLSQPEIMVA